jgi:hypothetical protein
MPVSFWSTTANTSSSIDPSINLSSGRAPSSVAPADRSILAAIAQYRGDISGSTLTTGTSTAYSLSTFSNVNQAPAGSTVLQTLGNFQLCFTPHVTNAAGPVTLSADAINPIPLRSSPGVELAEGMLVQGSPAGAIYNATDNAFYLLNIYGAPIGIPLGGTLIWWDTALPGSSFAWANGQILAASAVSPTLLARWGSRYRTTITMAGQRQLGWPVWRSRLKRARSSA